MKIKTSDEINTEILFLKEQKKLESKASAVKGRQAKMEEDREAAQMQSQQDSLKDKEQQRAALKTTYVKTMSEIDSIGSIKLSKAMKDSLPDFMTNATVRGSNNTLLTPMQDTLKDILANEKSAIQFAAILKNMYDSKSGNFNFKDIVSKAKNEKNRRN